MKQIKRGSWQGTPFVRGRFAVLEAVFEREMAGSGRVAILLELLGRQTRLFLSSEIIARI